ncbi:MAG: DUF4166 domain-containing protein [Pseudomonadota bacterium]
MSPYQQALGDEFGAMPKLCQALHSGPGTFQGEITVESAFGRVVTLLGFPKPVALAPFSLRISQAADCEIWERQIGPNRLRSEQFATQDGLLAEKMGPVLANTYLKAHAKGIDHIIRSVHVFGVLVPRALSPRISAREWQESGRYRFDVRVRAPIVNVTVLRYHGWLNVMDHACQATSPTNI